MSKTEILAELPKLTHQDRRAIMSYLVELEEDSDLLADHDRNADECFLMLDALEAENGKV